MRKFIQIISTAMLGAAMLSSPAQAMSPYIVASDSGDTAWMLAASAFVLMLAVPGILLIYAGLVRVGNVVSVLAQGFAVMAAISLLWISVGYSLAFGSGSSLIGGTDQFWLGDLANIRDETTIPESVFVLFQMAIAILAVLLIIGAYAERAYFGWVVGFSLLWSLLVYVPVTHWVHGGGWLAEKGALDFVGGLSLFLPVGISSLVVAKILGRRLGYAKTQFAPHSPILVLIGAGLVWVGWFGLAGGSALAANDDAASAILNMHIAASIGALCWAGTEALRHGRPTLIGLASGALSGLASCAAAAGYIGPAGAMILGAVGSICASFAVGLIKNVLRIDDRLDVFAINAVPAILSALLLPCLILTGLGGPGYEVGESARDQFVAQITAIGAISSWSIIGTVIAGYMVAMILPMRVSEDIEREGLDQSQHGEQGWDRG